MTANIVCAVLGLIVGSLIGLFVGRKNPKIADKAVEFSDKLK